MDDSAAPHRQYPCRVMRLLEMVTFSSVVKQSLSACLGEVMVCTDPDWRSVGPGFRFFNAFEFAYGTALFGRSQSFIFAWKSA